MLRQGEFLRTRTVVMQRKFEEELQKRTEDESTQVVSTPSLMCIKYA